MEQKDIDMKIEKVCVYCASSRQANPVYRDAARQLGEILAANSITTVYGGGAVGSMGALADGAISKGCWRGGARESGGERDATARAGSVVEMALPLGSNCVMRAPN